MVVDAGDAAEVRDLVADLEPQVDRRLAGPPDPDRRHPPLEDELVRSEGEP